MAGLKGLIHEIHRRSLWQVLAIYLGGALLGYEAIQALTEGLGLPDWVPPFAIVLFIIGLPVVMATAVVQEGVSIASRSDAPAAREEGAPVPVVKISGVAAAGDDSSPKGTAGGGARGLFTWRNAIIGGVLAFALLGVVVVGYMTMRTLGIGPVGFLVAKGIIEERERIILADFGNRTGDPQLGRAATEAFRVDLAQSRLVTVVAPSHVAQVLERMQRPTDELLDQSLAREVAIREGIKALIAGEITTVGAGYVLSASLLSAETGDVLAASRATAEDSTQIIGAIDRLSGNLRERIGESLRSIRSNPALDRMTTSSLEALRKYSQAVRAIEIEGDYPKGIALLEEAVTLDTAFAMAYRKLGIAFQNVGEERTRAVDAMTRAFEHRDRLSDRERYLTVGTYYQLATNEQSKAVTAYRTLLDIHPDYGYALTNLSFAYLTVRDYERAVELGNRSLEVEPGNAINNFLALLAQASLGKFEEVATTLARMSEAVPTHPWTSLAHSYVASMRGDYDVAEAHVRALADAQRANPQWQTRAALELAALDGVRGKLSSSESHLRDAMALSDERGFAAGYLQQVIVLALLSVRFRGEADHGLRMIEEALERYPLESVAPLDRPNTRLALLYASVGRSDRARQLLAEYDPAAQTSSFGLDAVERHLTLGLIALAEDRLPEAITEFQRADQGICPICALPLLGTAYELAGEPNSALAAYEHYVTTPWLGRAGSWPDGVTHSDLYWLGPTYERLGLLYEERGDAAKAIEYYGRLVELWKDADPELQPRVEAARRAIMALSPDR